MGDRMVAKEGTKVRALREARGLLQVFGFNGFSFQHLADSLGIKKPSLYDHFKSKEELGKAMMEDYVQSFERWAETVEVFEPREQLGALFELFYKFSSDEKKICPMSAFSADLNTLPKGMRKPLSKMYELREQWVINIIQQGQKKKVFRTDLTSEELAQVVISLGLGSQMAARVTSDPSYIREIKESVYRLLEPTSK